MPTAAGSVAIIGAGMSGLTCGAALAGDGWSVTIFDKGRRPGGRMSTRTPSEEVAFDHGCQYFVAKSDEFAQHVQQWQTAGVVDEWRSPIVRFCRGRWETHSSRPKYVGTPRMQSLCQYLADGLDVRCSVQVDSVYRRDSGWHIETADSEGHVFDLLILAMPPVQSHRLLSGRVSLSDQDWPEDEMRACWTLMAVLSQPAEFSHDAVVFQEHRSLAWAARNNSKPGRPSRECWVVQASSEWSSQHLDLSKDHVRELLTEQFVSSFQGRVSVERATAHRWRYALPAESTRSPATGTRYLPSLRLGICGDWCEGDRVEAAWRSGRNLAIRILQEADSPANHEDAKRPG
ncbi:MAG: NAD(P)-binding protein [Planctomycetaceae bacterium]|nr:NAD(P)-binding protein [Planctomycetaceae bacterium]